MLKTNQLSNFRLGSMVFVWVFLCGATSVRMGIAGTQKRKGKEQPLTRSYQKSRYRDYSHFLSEVPAVESLDPQGAPLSRKTLVREKFSRIRPTQSEYGRTLVKANVERQTRKAKERNISKLKLVIERGTGFAVPAVLSHDGRAYVLDSHHGQWTNLILLEESGENPFILLKVLQDYRGKDKDDFVEGVFGSASAGGLEKGQYLRRLRHATLTERFDSLPKSFLEMSDNPHRSLVGAALSNYGVQADYLQDYVEFRILDHMLDLDAVPKTNRRFNRANIAAYAKVLYQGESLKFLETMLRKQDKKSEFKDQLRKASKKISSR